MGDVTTVAAILLAADRIRYTMQQIPEPENFPDPVMTMEQAADEAVALVDAVHAAEARRSRGWTVTAGALERV